MRQKKSFFTKNNRLDRVGAPKEKKNTNAEEVLLDAKMLSDFERISPGFSDKLMEMAKQDQKHMQKMDDVKVSISNNAMRMGRLSFVFIFVAICYFTYDLILNNMLTEGLIFGALCFASLLMVNCKKKNICKAPEDQPASPAKKTSFKKPPQRRRHYKRK